MVFTLALAGLVAAIPAVLAQSAAAPTPTITTPGAYVLAP
jgi:hypothetical protein